MQVGRHATLLRRTGRWARLCDTRRGMGDGDVPVPHDFQGPLAADRV